MLIRLMASSVRNCMRPTVRSIRSSAALLSGGGHDHHEPTPVHIPRPASAERTLFGSEKVSSASGPSSYTAGADDYASFFGAGVGVLLTFLAVTFYTDLFGMNRLNKDSAHAHHDDHKDDHSAHHTESHLAKETVKAAPVEKKAAPAEKKAEPVVEKAVEEVSEKETPQSTPELESSTENEVHPNGPPSEPITEEKESKTDEVVEEKKEQVVEDTHESPVVESKKEAEPVAADTENEKIPESVEYLLVGAGTAAYYAALAIRARHADAKVLMIGEETHLPYNRPPLSKELWWYGDERSPETLEYKALSGKKRDVFFESKGFFVPPCDLTSSTHGGVSLLSGRRVVRLCPEEKKAFLDDGSVVTYGKCLIATGSKPKTVPELEAAPEAVRTRVLYFRGVDDYRKLEKLCRDAKTITVVGGGFLGSELAYGIKRKYQNMKINQVISESGNLANVLPEYLSKQAAEAVRKGGVNVITNSKIAAARISGDSIELQLNGGNEKKVQSDYVLVAIGVEPDTALAEASGLEVDAVLGGVAADAELRVRSGIYAAGDACSFYDKSLGRRRVEHWENAQISGRLAGENMTGGEKAFWYQPSFFTKISPRHHINAVGNTDSSLRTVSVFAKETEKDDYERGVVFYKGADDRIVGVLLVNVFGPSVDVSRRLIEEARPVDDFRQLAKLFPLYENPKQDE